MEILRGCAEPFGKIFLRKTSFLDEFFYIITGMKYQTVVILHEITHNAPLASQLGTTYSKLLYPIGTFPIWEKVRYIRFAL